MLWPPAAVTADVAAVRAPAPVTQPALPAPASAVRVPPAGPGVTADATGFVPSRLVVEAVGIDAPLLATSVDHALALVPPEDPAELGWWRGVRPGAGAGAVLVAGHLDSRRLGRGPLAALVDLASGDVATVTAADGTTASYVLRGVEVFDKDALPAGELFGYAGPERLVLVTCGGRFDRSAGGWDSNVVAVLDPVPA